MTTAGWVFDVYPQGDRMVCWIKRDDGSVVRLEDDWTSSIYVAADSPSRLEGVLGNEGIAALVKSHEFVDRYEMIADRKESKVLKLTTTESSKAASLARQIERLGRFGQYRLYNVDLLPGQAYFYERVVFPLCRCRVESRAGRLIWAADDNDGDGGGDDVWSTGYKVPDLKKAGIAARIKKEGRLPRFTDALESISIEVAGQEITIEGHDEADIFDSLHGEMRKADPDLVFTEGGDSFLFPYLVSRAEQNGKSLAIGRDGNAPSALPLRDGTSYFSYGKVHFKPTTARLAGRVHIDWHNSFVHKAAGLDGLYEVARICRMPLHTAARASIGKCMSSIQFYHATQKGLLIPWKPVVAEHFKSFKELLLADRGGFIFEPEIGVHEKVAEFDFASLYPSIMKEKNISAETVRCECCPDSKRRVPVLGYNICEKRDGIVPTSLKILLEKRARYKLLKKSAADPELKKRYDDRQGALKWILVTSFGYLGFNNAKFGRIDAHIAVCAFDRHVLLQASRIAERRGFRVLHGIVDSLWIQKRNATAGDYAGLKNDIEQETGFEISFEGVYKWIAFVHSKQNDRIPVPNRYFGVFEDGTIKIKGLAARRHDTPPLFSRFQTELLQAMAKGDTVAQVKVLLPELQAIVRKYKELLKSGQAAVEDLAFTKQTSKDLGQHSARNMVENSVLWQLDVEGRTTKAGQTIHYVITDYYNAKSGRATPVEMLDKEARYDVRRYLEMLSKVGGELAEPFGRDLG